MEVQPVSIKKFLGQEFARIPEVDAVFVSVQGRTLHVWIVVDQFDGAVREKIYEKEMGLIDELDSFEFDFNILSRRGRNLTDVVPDASLDLTFLRGSHLTWLPEANT